MTPDAGPEAPSTSRDDASLRLLLSQVPAVLWTTDRDLRFTSSQGAALASRGYDPKQFLGMPLTQFYATDDTAHPSIAAHLRALKGESCTYEDQVWGGWWESQVEPLRDPSGAIVGVVGISLDVSERKQAESLRAAAQEAWRESEENLRLVTDQIPAVLWSIDAQLQISMVRGGILTGLGLPPERITGRPLAEIIAGGDPTHPRMKPYLRALAGQSVAFESIFLERALDVHLQPLRNAAGEILGVVAVALDITDRKQAEDLRDAAQQELEVAYASLEERVQERTRELAEAVERQAASAAENASTL